MEHALEERLTPTEVSAITAHSLSNGLRRGVTMHVEHLHAPRCVEAALTAQACVAEQLGARLINSHATSSLESLVTGPTQVEANAAYAARQKGHKTIRGAIGLHSSSLVDDAVLRVASRAKEELAVGAHFRLAENDDDLAATWTRYGTRVVARFEHAGLLGGGSVGAFARAVDRIEAARLAQSRTLIALSPRCAQTLEGSSAFGKEAALVDSNLVGLGTGGIGGLAEESAALFSDVLTLCRSGRMLDADALLSSFMVGGPAELCTMVFGHPSGCIEPGALADVVVFDWVPATASSQRLFALLTRLGQLTAAWTIVGGRVVVREGVLVGPNPNELASEAAQAISSVWVNFGSERSAMS
jgi:cytosine/adenosine deaminase-related metal-dependent hydrolase